MQNRCPHHAEQALWPLRAPTAARGCNDCQGLWLPGLAVAAAIGEVSTGAWQRLPTTALSCPDDETRLHARNYQEIEIDLCPECGGVWLDRGELQAILVATQAEGESILDELDAEDAVDLVDALFDGISPRSNSAQPAPADSPLPRSAVEEFIAETARAPAAQSAADWAVEREDVEAGGAELHLERDDPLPRQIDPDAPSWSLSPIESEHASPGAEGSSIEWSGLDDAGDGLGESVSNAMQGVIEFIGEALSDL